MTGGSNEKKGDEGVKDDDIEQDLNDILDLTLELLSRSSSTKVFDNQPN